MEPSVPLRPNVNLLDLSVYGSVLPRLDTLPSTPGKTRCSVQIVTLYTILHVYSTRGGGLTSQDTPVQALTWEKVFTIVNTQYTPD